MHVRVRFSGFPDTILVVESKLTRIEEFKNVVREKFRVEPEFQLLFYGGKLLEDDCTFHDYNIKLNDVIQLMEKQKPSSVRSEAIISPDKEKRSTEVENRTIYKETRSKLYKVGDLVDIKHRQLGSWEEGVITQIVIATNIECKDNDNVLKSQNSLKSNASGPNKETDNDNILYKTKFEHDETHEYYCKLSEIRPRARNVIDAKDVQVGQMVMINHNIDKPNELGDWYDFIVEDIVKMRKQYTFIGELVIGPESVPSKATVKVKDKIFAIEEPVPLSQRNIKYNQLIATSPPKRSRGVICRNCKDDPDKLCNDCGCLICWGKKSPETIIICDECDNGFHLNCLDPPLATVPVDDWFCSSCKRDPNEVIAPGGSKQPKKTSVTKNTRDWGRGMACVGKTKNSDMPIDHFGPIPGIEVGMSWRYRMQLSETGLHRPSVSGIHGRDAIGAFSIVLSGGYEDDEDHGTEFTYTGSGGRDLSGNKRTAKQSSDQKFVRENRALARNCAVGKVSENGGDAGKRWREGKPVRVMRSCKMLKASPKYAPKNGIRYDGIYKVVRYYPEIGRSGFRVYKYLLRRDDPSPAPWEPSAKKYDVDYPEGYLEAETQKKSLKNKNKSEGTNDNSSESVQIENKNKQETSDRGKKRTLEVNKGQIAKRLKLASNDQTIADETLSENSIKHRNQSKSKKSQKKKGSKGKANKNMDAETSGSGSSTSPAAAESDEKPNKLSSNLKKLIESDKLNSKLWKEALDIYERHDVKEFIESIQQTFRCIVCQGVLISPVTTPCSHNFCFTCLKRAFKTMESKNCPHCRQSLADLKMQINENLQYALRIILPGYDSK